MLILTTNDIASFQVEGCWFNSASEVSKECRDKKMFGWKPSGHFQSWQIPADSLAYYLRYFPLFKESFTKIQLEGLDPEMAKKVKTVKKYLDIKSNASNETYTITILSEIFGVPRNQIIVMFCSTEPIWRRTLYSIPMYANLYSHSISIGKVIRYLEENPSWVDRLYERHQMALATGKTVTESLIRHLLMLFSYYKSNGYLL